MGVTAVVVATHKGATTLQRPHTGGLPMVQAVSYVHEQLDEKQEEYEELLKVGCGLGFSSALGLGSG